jgi:hypothetical protein
MTTSGLVDIILPSVCYVDMLTIDKLIFSGEITEKISKSKTVYYIAYNEFSLFMRPI